MNQKDPIIEAVHWGGCALLYLVTLAAFTLFLFVAFNALDVMTEPAVAETLYLRCP